MTNQSIHQVILTAKNSMKSNDRVNSSIYLKKVANHIRSKFTLNVPQNIKTESQIMADRIDQLSSSALTEDLGLVRRKFVMAMQQYNRQTLIPILSGRSTHEIN